MSANQTACLFLAATALMLMALWFLGLAPGDIGGCDVGSVERLFAGCR